MAGTNEASKEHTIRTDWQTVIELKLTAVHKVLIADIEEEVLIFCHNDGNTYGIDYAAETYPDLTTEQVNTKLLEVGIDPENGWY